MSRVIVYILLAASALLAVYSVWATPGEEPRNGDEAEYKRTGDGEGTTGAT